MALRKVGPQGHSSLKSYPAESALTRGYGAKVGALEGNCTAITAAGAAGIGIVSESCAQGDNAAITRLGDSVAIAGAAATQGQWAKFDATGRVIPVAKAAGTTEEVVGRFESSPTAANDECIIFVNPFTLTTPAA